MRLHQLSLILLYALTILICGYLMTEAAGYYALDGINRPHHDRHEAFKPSGSIGHGLGIFGSALMLILLLYSVRKRARWAQRLGNIRFWLNYHIWMGVTGPLLIIFHTSFKLGGIVAVSFWAMIGVAVSGVVGRYIYIQIPRSREGHLMSAADLEESENALLSRLGELGVEREKLQTYQKPAAEKPRSSLGSLIYWLTADIKVYFVVKSLRRTLRAEGNIAPNVIKEAVKLFKQRAVLRRRIEFLGTAELLMHYWHVFHKPFAIVMLVIMVVHIVVTILFGAKWIF